MTSTFSISELAREFDITPRTIRFYEDQGLITPTRNGQHRVYSSRDRVRLRLILRGKRLGFSLAESKELIELYDPESCNRLQLETLTQRIRESRLRLNQQLKDIKAIQKELSVAEVKCKKALTDVIEA